MARQAESGGLMLSSMKTAMVRMCGLPSIREGIRRGGGLLEVQHTSRPFFCACRECVSRRSSLACVWLKRAAIETVRDSWWRSTRLPKIQRVRSYPFSAVVMAGFTLTEEQLEMLRGRLGERVPAGSKQWLNWRWMTLKDFNGNQSEWSDWAFGFKRAIRGEIFEIMEKVERANADFEEDELNQFAEHGDVSKISGVLYDLLCTVVNDEAMTVVRSEDEFRGFRAWYKLHMKYNPRTMARAVKLMGEVSSPGRSRT